ncbi:MULTISPECIES: ROK family protein [unclassified Microbacterium]|uniref:ROK family protein n=1 Tax=unclassified Microbacterium TaxID=2609290 RepID=UPI003649B787
MAGSVNGLASTDVRRHNLSIMLRHLAAEGPCSRSDLAERTGLKRSSITPLVQILQEAGLLQETTSILAARGRPRTNLELTGDRFGLLVLQFDALEITGVVTTLGGRELAHESIAHDAPFGDPGPVLDVAAKAMTSLLDAAARLGSTVIDATVVTKSPVGGEPVHVLADAHMGWRSVDVLAELGQRVSALGGIRAQLSSDAPLAAQAELRRIGSPSDAIYLRADATTVGGALIVDGRVVEGAHGFGGSLGHLAVVPDGALCACGQHGCLVTATGEDVAAPSAIGWIARTLQILSMAVDPDVIVVGGLWAPLAESIATAFEANRPALARSGGMPTTVHAGVLGIDAALLGGIEAAQQRVLEDPERIL